MENKDRTELKPVYIQDSFTHETDNNINLVDIALVLIRRKMLFVLIFTICVSIGIGGYIFTSSNIKPDYKLSASIQIGHSVIDGKIFLLESTDTLLAKIRTNFIPEILSKTNEKYVITASNPKLTELVILEITFTSENDTNPADLLNALIHRIEQDHNQIYSAIKNSLDLNLKSTDLIAYASILSHVQKTRIVSAPIKSRSNPPLYLKGGLLLVVSLFAGLFLGLFAVFFAEFVLKVKEKQKEIN